jgi:hypothetical protein
MRLELSVYPRTLEWNSLRAPVKHSQVGRPCLGPPRRLCGGLDVICSDVTAGLGFVGEMTCIGSPSPMADVGSGMSCHLVGLVMWLV